MGRELGKVQPQRTGVWSPVKGRGKGWERRMPLRGLDGILGPRSLQQNGAAAGTCRELRRPQAGEKEG